MKKILVLLLSLSFVFTSCSSFLDTLDEPLVKEDVNKEQDNKPNTEPENNTPDNKPNTDPENNKPNQNLPYDPSGKGDYYISFDLNGHGNESFKTFTGIPNGTEILFDKLPTPKNEENWIFDGWYDDTDTKMTSNFIIRRNYNLKARWRSLITDKPYYLPKTTSGTDSTVSRYVIFGDWPQTIKDDDVTIDETVTKDINGWKCYKGSDNCYYVKEKAVIYSSNYPQYPSFSNNEIKQEGIENYFKMEPIKWRVMDTQYQKKDQYLLFAENALYSTPYYIGEKRTSPNKIYNSNYENSTLRATLVGISYSNSNTTQDDTYVGKGMIHKAFTTDAQKLLLPNEGLHNDKVFILSEAEINSGKYFDKTIKDDISVYRGPTDYVKNGNTSVSFDELMNTIYNYKKIEYIHWPIIDPSNNDSYSYIYGVNGCVIGAANSNVPASVVPAIIVKEIFEY